MLVSYPSTRDSITRLSSTVAGTPLEPVQLKVLRAPAKTVKGKSAGGHVKKLYAIDYNREATISEQGLLTWQ